MNKDQLRIEYRNKRKNLNIEEKTSLDQLIFDNLKQLDWSSYKYVHVYLPLAKFNEPDTLHFIKWIKEYFPQINLVVSKSNFANGEMLNYKLENNSVLVENKWGIVEPQNGVLIVEQLIDLVLVPLLIMDKQGNRVGYGKGFYDRFLRKCRDDIKTIGISYFEPIEAISDVNEWDIPLTNCITPKAIYSFKKK